MRKLVFITLISLLVSCQSAVKHSTLRDVDIVGPNKGASGVYIKPKNDDDIRAAYAEYLQHASKQDVSRLDALQRLAQLEFDLTEKLYKNKGVHTSSTLEIEDRMYDATLNRSIELLEISLRDYPNAEKNDRTLYQLAKAYDQKGEQDKSIAALQKLAAKYPKSNYYVETQFRLAEYAFSTKNYSKAEDIYTDILVSKKNSPFFANARYKRGWARFKQEFYQDAVEDFIEVIDETDFGEHAKLNETQRNQFDEYFRAVGLSFSYMGGAAPMHEYFLSHPGFKYVYHAYSYVSDIYLSQQRYSDAVEILELYMKHYSKSAQVPLAGVKILTIWKIGGFTNKLIPALNDVFTAYNPQSKFWQTGEPNQEIYNLVTTALKEYIVLAASHYHKEYQTSRKEPGYANARLWYERYLKHYKAYSHKDNIHLLYAELLSQHKDLDESLYHYELAAYDGDIILNKDAAYATILLATQLHRNSSAPETRKQHLDKLISYSLLYTQLYPNDQNAMKVMTHAAQEAYREGMFENTIKLTEVTDRPHTPDTYNINMIKAHSYFKLKQYQDAETAYASVLQHYRVDANAKKQINENIAASIYNQATAAAAQNNTDNALRHYARISDAVPASDIGATGLYDAIALCINNNMWNESIQYIKKFQSVYPMHSLNHDVSKKLSVAYLNSNQDIAAASELLKISRVETNAEYKIAALWKAGELYESKKDYASAITSYEEYAKTYQRPFPQYMESLQKLITLYTQTQNEAQVNHWRKTVLDADKRTPAELKSDRTKFIASQSALQLAKTEHARFSTVRLSLPLNKSLSNKKYLMQKAVNLYGRASAYGVADTATEATHAIAEIYRDFSKSLLDSDRPTNLNKTELEQYNILLEDQAFPFEEKAIEFYETNLAHVKDDVFDEWMEKSYARLRELFPARYNREVILETYINVLH